MPPPRGFLTLKILLINPAEPFIIVSFPCPSIKHLVNAIINIDLDECFKLFFELRGAPQSVLKSEQEVMQLRQQRKIMQLQQLQQTGNETIN